MGGTTEVPGIKLFGATISLEISSAVNIKVADQEEEPKKTNTVDDHNGDEDEEDQTVEMKRPEKIIACPRCKSMETKFCYFNNYNVNQPRHFCKGCQRYWTAGGALRNVPVGAGRRKAKPPCRDYDSAASSHFDFDFQEWHVAAAAAAATAQVLKRRRGSSSGSLTCA